MKDFQIDDVRNLNELPNDLFIKVRKIGLLTGSAVFGGWVENISDVDYIFVEDKNLMNELAQYIVPASGSVKKGTSFRAFYANYLDFRLNLIVVKDQKHFDAWKEAHDLTVSLIENNEVFKVLMKVKKFRVKQFQLLREVFGWSYNIDDGDL